MSRNSWKSIFTAGGGLRAGWRFALFAGFWLASGYILFPLVSLVHHFSETGFTAQDILAYKTADALYMISVSALLVRLERQRMSWFGFGLERGTLRLFLAGSLWAAAMVSLLLFICCVCGYVTYSGLAEHGSDLWKYTGIWLAAMLLVGLDEELQFRGYALASLTRGVGFWPAAILLSLGFAGDHLTKPMETVPDVLNIALLGLFVCYSVRRTGSLWFAIGFHASFDFFALAFYGSPNTGNSGLPLPHHLLEMQITGPSWLTGGPQGIEASWLVPPLLAVMLELLRRVYPTDRYPHA
jgi:membrane protease YdiL (CAAX protease family)